jgi:hypothetical protein
MTNFTNEQLEAWAGLGPWLKQYSPTIDAMQIIETVERDSEGNVPIPRKIAHVYEGQRMDMDRIKLHSDALAAAPALAAALLAERKAREVEVANLKGLAWIAYHEFNAINARSGGPLDQYGMVTVTHEYWQAITDLLAKAAGETTPWPTDNAKAIFEQIEREREKDQPHD